MSLAVEKEGLGSLLTAEDYRDFIALEHYSDALESLMETYTGLETLQINLPTALGSPHSKTLANCAYRSHLQRLGVATEGFDVQANDETFLSVSQEGIGKALANIWKAIKKAWNKVKEYAKKFFQWFVNKGKALLGKSDDLVKQLKKMGDTPISNELKEKVVAVAKWTEQYQDLIDKVYPEYIKSHHAAQKLVGRVMDEDLKDSDKLASELEKSKKDVEKATKALDKIYQEAPKLSDSEKKDDGKGESKVKDIEKNVVFLDKALGKTKDFVEKLKEDHQEDNDLRDKYDAWIDSKKAEDNEVVSADLMRIGFNSQLQRFQGIAALAIKEIHGVLKDLEDLIKVDNVDFKSLKGNGEYKPSENLEKFVKNSDLPHIRTALRLELNKRMLSSKDLYGAMNWVEKEKSGLFDEYEENKYAKAIETDKKKWTVDYYSTQVVYLKTNFSKKRFSHLISVREFLYDKLWS